MDAKAAKRRTGHTRTAGKTHRADAGTLKIILCGAIILSGIVIKFAFNGSTVHSRLYSAVHGSVDYEQAAAAIGRAISGEQDIISVFKELTSPPSRAVSADTAREGEAEPVSEDVSERGGDNAEVQQLKSDQAAEAIERLSFEMSEAELSDDTKAEPFVIPPPSYCSYKKEDIPFKYAVPLRGKVTSPYGYRDHPVGGDASFHSGMDIAAAKGTKVGAFADGQVLQASSDNVYGKFVLIEHAGGIRTFYGHNSKLCVKNGQRVKLGQKIAEVGTTGLSTGPHVHFEVRKGNLRLDPRHYISPDNV